MKNNVTIEGDRKGTIIKPSNENLSKPMLLAGTRKTANFLVKNIVFDGGGRDFANAAPVIVVTEGTNIIFDRITLQNTHGMGLLLQGDMKSSGVRNSQFINIGNHWRTRLQRRDRLQALVFCCGAGNANNFAIGNSFKDIGLDALQIANQNGFVATDNIFDLEGHQFEHIKSPDFSSAIFPLQSINVKIDHNQIHNAPGNGIDAPGLQHSTITNNIISGCGCAGIGLFRGYDKTTQTNGVSIVGNKVTNNVHWTYSSFIGGITIAGGEPSHITVSGNTVTDTQIKKTQAYGIQVLKGTHVTALRIDHNNQLSGNRIADMFGIGYANP